MLKISEFQISLNWSNITSTLNKTQISVFSKMVPHRRDWYMTNKTGWRQKEVWFVSWM